MAFISFVDPMMIFNVRPSLWVNESLHRMAGKSRKIESTGDSLRATGNSLLPVVCRLSPVAF